MSDDVTPTDGRQPPGSEAVTPETVRRAIREIRWEGRKAAFIVSAVEGALVFAVTNLGLSVVTVPVLAGEVLLPGAVVAALQQLGGTVATSTIPTRTLAAAGLGTLAAILTFSLRLRRPTVERFERANPPVAEALRTARDAVREDTDNPVTRRLYANVVARLRDTSSIGLLPLRRLTVMIVLVLVVSLLSVQATVVGVQLASIDGSGSVEGPSDPAGLSAGAGQQTPEYEGLQSGEDVLGEPEDVDSGSENLSAVLSSQPGPGESEQERSYERSGLPASSESPVDPRQAGFEAPEELDDADLIREYNLQIRSDEEGS